MLQQATDDVEEDILQADDVGEDSTIDSAPAFHENDMFLM